MNKNLSEAKLYVQTLLQQFGNEKNLTIVLLVPFPYINCLSAECGNSSLEIGAQSMFHEEWGGYTGEVSAPILASIGCSYVMIGHSYMRGRALLSNAIINRKMFLAMKHGIIPILCIGETSVEKRRGMMEKILDSQIGTCIKGFSEKKKCWVCYEPRWAIGAGSTPAFEEIERTHLYIKRSIESHYDKEAADMVPVIYGGSVNESNAASIYQRQGVDGVGFGTCSLDIFSFSEAIRELMSKKKAPNGSMVTQ